MNPGGSHPNSSAAAASFDAAASALGTVGFITFESAPLGAFTSLAVAPGVTIGGTDYLGHNQRVLSVPSFTPAPSLGGFNTTSGGANYVDMVGGTLVFHFATPTQFFAAYLTGIQTAFYQDTFTFTDGTTQTINVPGAGTSSSLGAMDFVGFTDAGQSIVSLTINAGNPQGADEIGVDDVRYQTPAVAVTPEPGTFVLAGTGLMAILLGAARRRFV